MGSIVITGNKCYSFHGSDSVFKRRNLNNTLF